MKQATGKRIWFSTGQVRTVWYDPQQYIFWVQKWNKVDQISKKHVFLSMKGVENFVIVNGLKFVEPKGNSK